MTRARRVRAAAIVGGCIVAGCAIDQPADEAARQGAALRGEERFTWTKIEAPGALSAAMVAYDQGRERTVLFGGLVNSHVTSETWEWDGTNVRRVTPERSPTERWSGAMTYQTKRYKTVLFGGSRPSGQLGDTWEFDGATWEKKSPNDSPSPRTNGAMAYDVERGMAVLFGGAIGVDGVNSDETWLWDGVTWRQAHPAHSPAPRLLPCMTYDDDRQRVVLFGGSFSYNNGGGFNDTWEWDGADWTHVATAHAPSVRDSCQLGYDPQHRRTLLFGGDGAASLGDGFFAYDGSDWQELGGSLPPLRLFHAATFDRRRSQFVVVGGSSIHSSSTAGIDDLWVYDGSEWRDRTLANPSPGRFSHSIASDEARGQVVLFGGRELGSTTIFDQTWTWDGTTWTRRHPLAQPPARQSPAMANDTQRARVVLFGGHSSAAGYLGDTWEWDGTSWESRVSAHAPGNRIAGAIGYDRRRHRTVLLGGMGQDGVLGDLWEWDGSDWTAVTAPNGPAPRTSARMAFEPASETLLLFGGNLADGSPSGETWSWDGQVWKNLTKVSGLAPPARAEFGMVTHDALQRVFLFGGSTNFGLADDLWYWDAQAGAWVAVDEPIAPTPRYAFQVAYHAPTRALVLNGGAINLGPTTADPSVTWTLTQSGTTCAVDDDCPGGFCTDGVCCGVRACATCETCDGTSPGRCTPVLNAEDPDSCTGAHACDARGVCKSGLGAPAELASDCATGFLVDGVCCDSACDGPCLACAAALKQSSTRDGVCDHARGGTNPRGLCHEEAPESCGYDGTCDEEGACRKYRGNACGPGSCNGDVAAGQVCSGAGACIESQGVSCGGYACHEGAGCLVACATNDECASTHRCEGGRCQPREGASCDGDHTVKSPDGSIQDCQTYRCAGDRCLTACTSIADCSYPNECSAGACVPPNPSISQPPAVGCAVQPAKARSGLASLATLGVLAIATRRRRRLGASAKT